MDINQQQGVLSLKLSAHPITLVSSGGQLDHTLLCCARLTNGTSIQQTTFLAFRLSALLIYLFGLLFSQNYVLVFIITILTLAADFYYLKNIAGRRLVGLRWWNEVNVQSGESHWVFESAPQPNEPGCKMVNATDKRFFWLALYCQPALWVALAVVAVVKLEFIWLTLVGQYFHAYGSGRPEELCEQAYGPELMKI